MFKALLVSGLCFVIAAAGVIGMYVADNKSVHRSVAKREHTHYTKLNIDFEKEVCIEFYDNGSWFPVYVCESR
jgi:hypothetical protein